MPTIDAQLIHMVINSVALLGITVVLALTVRLVRKIRRERPSESLVNELRAEVERFTGLLADLEERFSRFQKRQGMRHAREQKESQRDLVAEAASLVSGNAGQPGGNSAQGPTKVELYRRARGLNS